MVGPAGITGSPSLTTLTDFAQNFNGASGGPSPDLQNWALSLSVNDDFSKLYVCVCLCRMLLVSPLNSALHIHKGRGGFSAIAYWISVK